MLYVTEWCIDVRCGSISCGFTGATAASFGPGSLCARLTFPTTGSRTSGGSLANMSGLLMHSDLKAWKTICVCQGGSNTWLISAIVSSQSHSPCDIYTLH